MAHHEESFVDKVKRALGFGDGHEDHADDAHDDHGHDHGAHDHAQEAHTATDSPAATEPTERAAATGAAEAASWEGATGGLGASGAMGGAGAGGPVGTAGPETGDDATRGANAGAVRTEYDMGHEGTMSPAPSGEAGAVDREEDGDRRSGSGV